MRFGDVVVLIAGRVESNHRERIDALLSRLRSAKASGRTLERVSIPDGTGALSLSEFLGIAKAAYDSLDFGGELHVRLALPKETLLAFEAGDINAHDSARLLYEATSVASSAPDIKSALQKIGFLEESLSVKSGELVAAYLKPRPVASYPKSLPKLWLRTHTICPWVSTGIVAGRLVDRALSSGIPTLVSCWDVEPKKRPPDSKYAPLLANAFETGRFDVSFHLEWPPNVLKDDLILSKGESPQARIGYFYHEMQLGPRLLVERMNDRFDHCLFISEFCREAFVSGGLKAPSGVIHHGYDPEVFYPRGGEKTRWKDEFVFLSVATQQRRKGTVELIRAFKRAFSGHKDVRLVIKDIKDPWIDYRALAAGDPRITLIQENYSFKEIGDLLRDADCFALPTYGEGFGMPLLEARACGLPVITTNWGGATDFCKTDDSYLIDYDLAPRDDSYEYREDGYVQMHARPRESHLEALMLAACEDASDRQRRAALALSRSKEMTWGKVLNPFNLILGALA